MSDYKDQHADQAADRSGSRQDLEPRQIAAMEAMEASEIVQRASADVPIGEAPGPVGPPAGPKPRKSRAPRSSRRKPAKPKAAANASEASPAAEPITVSEPVVLKVPVAPSRSPSNRRVLPIRLPPSLPLRTRSRRAVAAAGEPVAAVVAATARARISSPPWKRRPN